MSGAGASIGRSTGCLRRGHGRWIDGKPPATSHGNEHWEFDDLGYMRRRDASINDYRIDFADRRIHVDRD